MKDHPLINGFAVCSLILAIMAFVGVFYTYIAHAGDQSGRLHLWFLILFPSGPTLMVVSLALGLIGYLTCRRHPEYAGKRIAVVSLIIGALALSHWLGQVAVHYL